MDKLGLPPNEVLGLRKDALKTGDQENGASSIQDERAGKKALVVIGPQLLCVRIDSVLLIHMAEMSKTER